LSQDGPDWERLLSLHPEFVEIVARRVLEITAAPDVAQELGADDLLTVSEVAARLRVNAKWVYAHQAELGAIRLGVGPKARLRFDPRVVDARLPRAAPPEFMVDASPRAPEPRKRRRLRSRPVPSMDSATATR
jgi:hypothetical protein